LHREKLDSIVCNKLGLQTSDADLSEWQQVITALNNTNARVKIAMVGKYINLTDAYKSLNESLIHAGLHTGTSVEIVYVDSEELENSDMRQLELVDAILVPGGFGERGIEGKIAAAKYARINNIPYLGICLGMQVAVVEFARNVALLDAAHSTEFDPHTKHPVIALISEWQDDSGEIKTYSKQADLGGTMRLGGQNCRLAPESKTYKLYGKEIIRERHRHRYEFNNKYTDILSRAGLMFAGRSMDLNLVEVIENPQHIWFVGCQFHPEFTSTPRDGHPLFKGFILAARNAKGE
jgi:CTP synthase